MRLREADSCIRRGCPRGKSLRALDVRLAIAGKLNDQSICKGEETMRLNRTLLFVGAAVTAALVAAAGSLGKTAAAPSNTSLPSISGSARDGSLLTASHGSWTGSPTTFAYQWLRCDAQAGNCSPISGATS